jgi:hypothetical protein
MDSRFENYAVEQQRQARRDAQQRVFRRNQAIGVLLVALAILVFRLLHTPSGWIFPAGWWRLW